MKGKLFKQEWKAIFSNRKMLVSIVAILFIPVLYGGMFLWAFWDPYGQMDELPVAIVNQDKGAEMNGEKMEIGKEFVAKLKESKEFDFQFVSKEEGYKKLKDQNYYLLVEIPENFSENATTVLEDDPKKLELKYVPNESFNFLSAQIGETAIDRIKAALAEKVTETYAETVFENLTKMAEGYQTASESAGTLNSGINEVNNGTKTLEEKLALFAEKQLDFKQGTNRAYDGSSELANGTKSLASGLDQLGSGQKQLLDGAVKAEEGSEQLAAGISEAKQGLQTADESMARIVDGSAQLKQGADTLNSSLTTWKQGAGDVSDGATQVQQGITALEQQLTPYLGALPAEAQAQLTQVFAQLEQGSASVSEGTKNLASSAEQIAGGAAQLSGKLGELNQGQNGLHQGLQKLNGAASQLEAGAGQLQAGQSQLTAGLTTFGAKLGEAATGAKQLTSGASELSNGMSKLDEGSKALADGSAQLSQGTNQISEGTAKLADGSKEFKDKLQEAADDSSTIKADEKTYNMVAAPVDVEKNSLNKVPNYGTGFAPYFLSLGLFVGALLLSIVFPLKEPAGTPKSGLSWFLAKFGVIAAVGIIQALLACFILLALLGIEVQSVPLFILFAIITSLTFVTLIQLLVTTLGDPGRFIAILILILQLTTSAGTFPLELIPHQLQIFNPLFPMTYSVRGFKEVVSTGDFAMMWQNGFVLLGYMVVFMIGSLLYFQFKYKRSYAALNDAE